MIPGGTAPDARIIAASRVLIGISVALALVGLVYIFSPTIMPYHERFIGVEHEQLDSKVAWLLLALMKGMGASFLAVALALGTLARGPFRRREPWAWWTALAVGLMALVPLLWIALSVGLYTPWWLAALGIAVLFTALAISGSPARAR